MHATRARLPQKRTGTKKPAAKKAAPKKAALKPDAQLALALPAGVASLAAHRAAQSQRALPQIEIYAQVEWIAPARESWRRGELEVRRSACMPMLATREADGALSLTELPGQGDALRLDAAALSALDAGALVLTLPGMRVTLTEADLRPALPATRPAAQVLAFPKRA